MNHDAGKILGKEEVASRADDDEGGFFASQNVCHFKCFVLGRIFQETLAANVNAKRVMTEQAVVA
jgi:hypothetical protein